MPRRPRVVLVVGPSGAGKTSLIRRLVDGARPASPAPTLGVDLTAGRFAMAPGDPALPEALAAALPGEGLELELWEIGGREHREAPRGRQIDGLLLCYDATDHSSFLRAAHVICRHRLDRHLEESRNESVVKSRAAPKRLAAVLCGTKADAAARPVSEEEIRRCVQANSMQGAALTSAQTGMGVLEVIHALAAAMLQAEAEHAAASGAAASLAQCPAAEAWGLPCDAARLGFDSSMTSPRGIRPHEPPRGAVAAALVEVLGGGPSAPRTLARCLERGLLHRALHVWLCVPRTGALLLRRWAPGAPKHPGRWGPTCHGEVQCYGAEGDGHASELSAQAAVRLLREQLGLAAEDVGELEHWFSCSSRDGTCNEVLDVYVAAIAGGGLPPLRLSPLEEVDWVYFADVLNEKATEVGTVFHMEAEYRTSLFRRMRQRTVRVDVLNAFGEAALVDGYRAAGGDVIKV